MPDLLDLAGESLDGRIVQAGAVRRQHGLVSFQRLCSYPLIAQHIKWNALIQERVVRTAEVVDIGYLRTDAVYVVLTVARIDDGHFCKRLKVVVSTPVGGQVGKSLPHWLQAPTTERSEEHTSELQSLMRISYAV